MDRTFVGVGVDRAQHYLQAPRPRTLQRGTLQPVHRIGLPDAPVPRVAAHPPSQTLEQLPVVIAQCLLDRFGQRAFCRLTLRRCIRKAALRLRAGSADVGAASFEPLK